jgi:hypothetical protein
MSNLYTVFQEVFLKTVGRNSVLSPMIMPSENHEEIMWLALGDGLDFKSCISPYTPSKLLANMF